MVAMYHHRIYDNPTPWLVWFDSKLQTMFCGRLHNGISMARAVVDDFGNLVIVRGWM